MSVTTTKKNDRIVPITARTPLDSINDAYEKARAGLGRDTKVNTIRVYELDPIDATDRQDASKKREQNPKKQYTYRYGGEPAPGNARRRATFARKGMLWNRK